MRSSVADPACDMPKPAGHIVQALHDIAPAFALKVPASQLAHLRSLLAVAMAVVYVPGAHGALTALHTAPLMAAENVSPTVHGAHWRSESEDPAVVMPNPIGHVDQTPHDMRSALAVNVPGLQSSHVLSLDAVAAFFKKVPGLQGALILSHAVSLCEAENVDPTSHGAQRRSAMSEPALDMPSPGGHVDQAVHKARPALGVKVPGAHGAQVRSLVAVATAVVYVPAGHRWRTATHGATPPVTE